MRLPFAAMLLVGACVRSPSTVTDAEGLVTVTRRNEGGAVVLSVAPARSGLKLNAKSPPRLARADGSDQLLAGPVDADGEKFTAAATARLPDAAGILKVSICDSALGICRTTEVELSE